MLFIDTVLPTLPVLQASGWGPDMLYGGPKKPSGVLRDRRRVTDHNT
jgi:hypothetical protein